MPPIMRTELKNYKKKVKIFGKNQNFIHLLIFVKLKEENS